jgi:predicted ABC-type ATPase
VSPTLTFIAGANGSGKTTLTRWNPELFKAIPLLDPDAIANTLQTKTSTLFLMAAARHVLEASRKHLDNGESFAIETTLAGKNYLQMMLAARNRGFEIVLIYIGTENVETIYLGLQIACWRVATMFLHRTFVGDTNAALQIFAPQ